VAAATADAATTRSRLARLELRIDKEETWPDGPGAEGRLLDRWGLSKSPQEVIWVIAYDAQSHLRTVVEVSRGSHLSVDLHLPTMLAAVITSGCERFVLAHNHPSGNPNPSEGDLGLTRDVVNASAACGLYIEDHIIVTPTGKTFSFTTQKLLTPWPYGSLSNAPMKLA